MWMFIFGKRLNGFDPSNMTEDSIPSKLIKTAENITNTTLATDRSVKLWKLVKTPAYIKMEENLEYLEK